MPYGHRSALAQVQSEKGFHLFVAFRPSGGEDGVKEAAVPCVLAQLLALERGSVDTVAECRINPIPPQSPHTTISNAER